MLNPSWDPSQWDNIWNLKNKIIGVVMDMWNVILLFSLEWQFSEIAPGMHPSFIALKPKNIDRLHV
jgi:hypothetical protein